MGKKFHRNKEEKQAVIVKTFLDLVPERGFSALKIADIALKSEVSVGTVYRYFPEGLPSILRAILSRHFHALTDLKDFAEMGAGTLEASVGAMVRKHIRSHREELPVHLAVNRAILDNPDLLEEYNMGLDTLLKETAVSARASSPFLKGVPEDQFTANVMKIHSLLEAVIHRHLFVRPVFPDDDSLVQFLTKIILSEILGVRIPRENGEVPSAEFPKDSPV